MDRFVIMLDSTTQQRNLLHKNKKVNNFILIRYEYFTKELAFYVSGCGVVVAQEPSKLLGPVRVWSAAPNEIDMC